MEFYDELAEVALGWLGWTEKHALRTDVNAIIVAHRGRVAMLKATFGGGDEQPQSGHHLSAQTMSPALFDAIFG